MKELESELAEMVSVLSGKFLSGKIDGKKDEELISKILSERGKKWETS